MRERGGVSWRVRAGVGVSDIADRIIVQVMRNVITGDKSPHRFQNFAPFFINLSSRPLSYAGSILAFLQTFSIIPLHPLEKAVSEFSLPYCVPNLIGCLAVRLSLLIRQILLSALL